MDRLSHFVWIATYVLALQVLGVQAVSNTDLIGFIVAGVISFVLLCIVVTFIVISLTCKSQFYDRWLRKHGQVRMPREYFKKKKEIKRRLLAAESATLSNKSAPSAVAKPGHSRQPSVVNGGPPKQSVDTDSYAHYMDVASWVQGWSQNTSPRGVETLGATMMLEDEKDEEFRIETILVDNEVLDVGPYKNIHSNEQAVKGGVYSDPYIFSATGEHSTGVSGANIGLSNGDATVPSGEMVEMNDNNNYVYSTVPESQSSPTGMIRL